MNWVDILTAFAMVAGALFTGGLLLVAWRQLGGLRRQIESDARPYVVAQVVPGLGGVGTLDLVLQNFGKSIAHDVTLNIGSHKKLGDKDFITEALMTFASTPRVLVPGARIRVFWARLPDGGKEPAGIQEPQPVTISYRDDKRHSFAETYTLGEIGVHVSPAPATGSSRQGKDGDLKNIENAIRALSIHLGELRR